VAVDRFSQRRGVALPAFPNTIMRGVVYGPLRRLLTRTPVNKGKKQGWDIAPQPSLSTSSFVLLERVCPT
jgi:hypothetical protein